MTNKYRMWWHGLVVGSVDCSIAVAPQTSVPADFAYVTADESYVPDRTPNTPVDIAPEGSQNFIFAFTPTEPFGTRIVELNYGCTNTDPAGDDPTQTYSIPAWMTGTY